MRLISSNVSSSDRAKRDRRALAGLMLYVSSQDFISEMKLDRSSNVGSLLLSLLSSLEAEAEADTEADENDEEDDWLVPMLLLLLLLLRDGSWW